jgi:hypothetical protein
MVLRVVIFELTDTLQQVAPAALAPRTVLIHVSAVLPVDQCSPRTSPGWASSSKLSAFASPSAS